MTASPAWGELGTRLLATESAAWPVMLVLALFGAGLAATAARWPKALAPVLVGVAGLLGLGFVVQQASLVDDAFISFRHADNLLSGHGLVWNPGERVEGITNLGWTVLLAVGWALLPGSIEHVALIACGLSWLLVGGLLLGLSRTLHDRPDPAGPWVPWAAGLALVHHFLTSFATTGLETEFTAVLLLAGLLAWLRGRPGWASLIWMIGVVVRLDQALFWGMGFVATALEAWPRRDAARMLRYLAPLGLLAVVLLGKLAFYGDIMPNTYYAKSAGQTYVSYGLFYMSASYVAGHLWLLVGPAVAWVALARGDEQRFAALVGAMGVVWHAYVLKVGGDFMLGRFFVVMVPLLLLAAERTFAHLHGRRPALAIALGALLLGSARGVPLVEPRHIQMGLADEGTIYPVVSWSPLVVDHSNFYAGQAFGTHLEQRGIVFPLATSGIGMLGFYSRMPVIDLLGLTDPLVARQPVTQRGRPGHEKHPPPGYLDKRGVVLERSKKRSKWDAVREISLPPPWRSRRRWLLRRYDRALIERWRTEAPELPVADFDRFYREGYLPTVPSLSRDQLTADLSFLDRFYWDVNGRDARLAELVAELEGRSP
ncbi:MAG: hypothetical protein AAGA48_10185 [Myxococcota bacterium]